MKVTVLGAGDLGRDFAQVAAKAGHTVRLHDGDANAVMDAIDDVERRLQEAVDAGTLAETDREAALDRLDATTDHDAAVDDADLVLVTEAESERGLQELFADLEERIDREAIVASTARTVSITTAAAGLRHPDRAVGLHVQTPLDTPVIEVVVADQAAASTIERVEKMVEGLDRTAAVVRDHPGLVSARLALATEVEAMRLVEEGVAAVPDVDEAFALRYDLPMGPLERADRAGLDRRLDSLEYLAEGLGERFAPPQVLRDIVDEGHTGIESGTGFYEWEDGEPAASALPDPNVAERVAGPDDPAY